MRTQFGPTRTSPPADARRVDRTARRSRAVLADDLASFSSPADLLELSAVLGRYDDAETAEIRNLVDWTSAA